MSGFASQTTVSPEKSELEIKTLLKRYGASEFVSGWTESASVIGFRCSGRFVRFTLPLPELSGFDRSPKGRRRTMTSASVAHNQEIRRRWRALALVIKAKLEAVASEITTFESEFMAHIVMPDGKTVGQHAVPWIERAYAAGKVPQLMAWSGGEE